MVYSAQQSQPQEFKGYVFKIMGGQDKQGFPMRQGVLTPLRVRLLMSPGDQCFAGHGRRKGERRRKSVRGCIVSQDLSVLNLIIVKKGMREWRWGGGGELRTQPAASRSAQWCSSAPSMLLHAHMHTTNITGEADLPGLTDTEKPRMRGVKRASKIRKLFNLSKEDDVRDYVKTYKYDLLLLLLFVVVVVGRERCAAACGGAHCVWAHPQAHMGGQRQEAQPLPQDSAIGDPPYPATQAPTCSHQARQA